MNPLEELGLWYLRLNGYFTMPNFIVHGRAGARTDVDVLGVRFPHSREYPDDEKMLRLPKDKVDIVFAEAKKGKCEINGPWGKENDKEPLEYVLRRVGLFVDTTTVDNVAKDLYSRRYFPSDEESDKWPFVVRIVCIGKTRNDELGGVTQILWSDVIRFIANRFQTYRKDKADHDYWDSFGKFLWDELRTETLPSSDQIDADWKSDCRCWP